MTRYEMRKTFSTFSIYGLRDKTLNKIVYVGQTRKLLSARLQRHIEHARCLGRKNVSEYIRENGIDNFSIELLEKCASRETADAAEAKWIEQCGTLYPLGCNVWPGSVRGSRPIHINERVSKSLLGHAVTEDTREKIRQARKMQAPITDDGRAKISATHKGKKLSAERRAKMVEVWKKRKAGFYA